MASEVPREQSIGIFKPTKAERLQAKASRPAERRAEREGNDEKHLRAIRLCPCCIPGCTSNAKIDPHHLKCIPGTRGTAQKAPDQYVIPVCRFPHHEDAEKALGRGEQALFASHGIDCIALADALWRAPRGNANAYAEIVNAHRERAVRKCR